MLHEFFQIFTVTIAVGSLYALVALGYTLVYGVLKFINFAHSDVFVLGAWTSFTAAIFLLTTLKIDPAQSPWWVGVLVFLTALVVCGVVGYCIERFAYRPLRKAPRLNVLITAIGVSLLLQNVGQITGPAVARGPEKQSQKDGVTVIEKGDPLATVPFGASPKRMPTLLPNIVLNESTLAKGTLAGGALRGAVVLDQAVTLEEGRQYRLEVTRQVAADAGSGAAARSVTENLSIANDSGAYAAGAELRTTPRRSPQELAGATYELRRSPRVPINSIDVIIVAVSLSLMFALQVLIYRTKMGSAMRALSHNIETASLMGINTNRVISFTFVLGSVLAASAAFLYPMKYPGLNQTAHGIWLLLGLKAFVAAVVGGIGNVRGAVLGGFLIAAIEFFGAWAYAPLRDVYVFAVLILVLLYRPNGLLGKAVMEKV
jgi:branched-subunit amino acid ABC-type transport system permease component